MALSCWFQHTKLVQTYCSSHSIFPPPPNWLWHTLLQLEVLYKSWPSMWWNVHKCKQGQQCQIMPYIGGKRMLTMIRFVTILYIGMCLYVCVGDTGDILYISQAMISIVQQIRSQYMFFGDVFPKEGLIKLTVKKWTNWDTSIPYLQKRYQWNIYIYGIIPKYTIIIPLYTCVAPSVLVTILFVLIAVFQTPNWTNIITWFIMLSDFVI